MKLLRACLLALVAVAACQPASAQTLEQLAKDYRAQPTPQKRSALLRYAAERPKLTEGAQAQFVVAITDLESKNFSEAARLLSAARPRLPALADYVSFYLAEALRGSRNLDAALKEAEAVLRASPPSPLRARAALMAASIYLEMDEARQAVATLRRHQEILPQPQGTQRLAEAMEAAGDLAAAAMQYQRVFYEHPLSAESKTAESGLLRLRQLLAGAFPPAMPQAMLARAGTLMERGNASRARRELEDMLPQVRGRDQELVQVRLGAAHYFAREDNNAIRHLRPLHITDSEADAERLYYLLAASRRLERRDDVLETISELRSKHPGSNWRLEALVSTGNKFLLLNDQATYVPVYTECYSAFPNEPRAAYCHWKVTWAHYLQRRSNAASMLREHLVRFPSSDYSPAALYFLGRLAERSGDAGAARLFYEEITEHYPNRYYNLLARQRMESAALRRAEASQSALAFLQSVQFAQRARREDFAPNEATQTRVQRSRLLIAAGFPEWGETEIRFGARNGGQAHVLALEAAQAAHRRGAFAQGIRYIKGMAPAYLTMPLDSAPRAFWEAAFPLPYRRELERRCRDRSLDPHFFAALVRQESEFDPRALSRAKAMGLAQIMPATGRQLSRKLGVRGFRTPMLYQPDLNLNLGTYYLRTLLDSLGGSVEAALAAYNGGKTRVNNWLSWAEYAEPAEFVETIPFTETRNYVQTVLRNADIYRRLYASGKDTVTLTDGATSQRKPASSGPAKPAKKRKNK